MCEEEAECCHLCLSTERRLSSLEGVLDVYLLLVGSGADGDLSVENVRACWECRASLRRVARLQKQARWVRDVLDTADYLLLDKDMCLSKLKWTGIENRSTKGKIGWRIERDIINIDIEPQPITRQEPSQTSQDEHVSGTQDEEDTDPLALPVKEEEDESTDTNYIFQSAVSDQNEQYINEEVYDRSTFYQSQFEKKFNEDLVFLPVTQSKSSVLQQTKEYKEPEKIKQAMVILKKDYSPQVKGTDAKKSLSVDLRQVNDSSVEILESGGSSPQSFDHLDEIPDGESEPTIAQTPPKSDANTPSNTRLNVQETLLTNIILMPQHLNSNFSNIMMPAAVDNRNSIASIESTIHSEKTHPSSLLSYIIVFPQKDCILQNTDFSINRPIDYTHEQSVLITNENPSIDDNVIDTVEITTSENIEPKQQETIRSKRKFLVNSQTSNKENAKQFYESFNSNNSCEPIKQADLKIVSTPVTRSQLNVFLANARNNEQYLASPFKCEFCILGFTKESSLKKHMERYGHVVADNSQFTCDICHRGMPNQQTLDAHQSTHEFLYSCVADDFVSVCPLIVLRHYASTHAEKNENPDEQKVQKFLYDTFTPSKNNLMNMAKALNFTPSAYSCNDCCIHYITKESFLGHLKLHSEEAGAYVCEFCKMRFSTEDKLKEHGPAHEYWYRCKAHPNCQYIAPTYHDVYYFHYKNNFQTDDTTENKLFDQNNKRIKKFKEINPAERAKRLEMKTAKLLYEAFKPTEEELENMKLVTGFKPSVLTCDDCCLYFRNEDRVFQHRQLHSEAAGAHVCSVCTLRFTSAELLETHRSVHDTWYRCKAEGCLFTSNTLNRMQVHTGRHRQGKRRSRNRKPEGPFQCDVCKKVFTKFWSLNTHILIHNKQHMCEICGALSVSRTSLAAHMRLHNEKDKYYYCEYCPKRYKTAHKLKYHTNEHLNLNPYKCSKCDAKFSSPNRRISHMITEHEKYKRRTQNKCSVCSLVFNDYLKLADHYLTHEERFKYKCDKCPRIFMMYNNLVNHQTKHVSGPSFECEICNRKFHFMSSLNLHKYRTHKTQVCPVCGRRFSSSKALRTHKKLRHSGEESLPREK